MRDLEMWRRLARGEVSDLDLATLMSLPLARIAPQIGVVMPLVTHPDFGARAIAIAALSGVRGVAGVRALVAALDDPSFSIWNLALSALRRTAADAPGRYVHALFHSRAEVRRAALEDVPRGAIDAAAYLRADPACADLASALPWPDHPLPLAFDLHRAGTLTSAELLAVLVTVAPSDLRTFLESERGRGADAVEAYFTAAASAPVLPAAPGDDVLDQIARMVGEVDAEDHRVGKIVDALSDRKHPGLVRRTAAALLSRFATHPSRGGLGAAVAFAPLSIAFPGFPAERGVEAALGLLRYRWPVKPAAKQTIALLALPWVRADLAVAASVAGLLTGHRLKRLVHALGQSAILDSLVASSRGWKEILSLPGETPPLHLRWLGAIERVHPERHAELAGIALGALSGKALETLVDQLLRRSRPGAFLSLARSIAAHDPALSSAARVLAPRIDRTQAAEILNAVLADAMGDQGLQVALVMARALDDKQLASAGKLVGDAEAARFVTVLEGAGALPRDRELALANVWKEHARAEVRAWSLSVTRVTVAAPAVPLPAVRARRALTDAEREAIIAASPLDLEAALQPALLAPVTGLVAALAVRRSEPSVAACAALLGCADPRDEVALQLDRFGDGAPRFQDELDNASIALWRTAVDLPPLVHARLWRWEAHTLALGRWVIAVGGVLPALRAADGLPGWFAADTLWRGLAELVAFLRYRDRPWFLIEATAELARYVAAQIHRPAIGRHAARIAVCLVEGGGVPLSEIRAALLERTPDADAPTRELLARLVRLDGMPEPPRASTAIAGADVIAAIKACRDVAVLATWCADPRPAVVQEAVLALLLAGESGQERLAALLDRLASLPAPLPLLASIALWDHEPALEVARRLARSADLPPMWQFHLCLGLGDAEGAVAAARAPADTQWFRRADWDALVRAVPPLDCAIALTDSPQHHAYAQAIDLLEHSPHGHEPRLPGALRRFLEVDDNRPIYIRRSVARRLALDHGDLTGLPLLIEEILEEGTPDKPLTFLTMESGTYVARCVVDAALIVGGKACSEKRMWEILDRLKRNALVDPDQMGPLYVRILEEGTTALARRTAASFVVTEGLTHERLGRIAEAFAWGVKRGVELTGRLMRVHMTSKETDLGHTFLDQPRIFVSPLPMLREEAHGRDIVEGLILHELGHHAYHRGEEAQKLWKQAHAEGIGHLLNLIADEHLERNLRAVDRSYGDRLKRLGAYAFQHAPQELKIKVLLDSLRGSAATTLIEIELGVAFEEDCVRLRRGAVLQALERTGHLLARFARALRMGLGNRFDDPLVGAALELCPKGLKKLDMRGLYELTKQIAAMFGGSIAVARVFGGPEGLGLGEEERELDVHGAGIDDDILQREVERILDPRKASGTRSLGKRDRLQINVNPDEEYDQITTVTRVQGDPAKHRRLALEVNRHSMRLRAHLDDLGLRWEPQKARIAGRALDRGRLNALVTRGDPKILVARTPVRRTDLFLGTLIDCSGSMQAGDNIERARKFGVLIAEAVRPLAGVEARFFGFTDSVIWDAGDAKQCDVTGLEADGGNNDAAALHHVANLAAASSKRARVLVMISDGLPTQCSVAALKGLVTSLTRRKGMVCAQVAVRRLEEECFPNHVVLDDSEIDVAVARFGRMIGDLTRKALGS